MWGGQFFFYKKKDYSGNVPLSAKRLITVSNESNNFPLETAKRNRPIVEVERGQKEIIGLVPLFLLLNSAHLVLTLSIKPCDIQEVSYCLYSIIPSGQNIRWQTRVILKWQLTFRVPQYFYGECGS